MAMNLNHKYCLVINYLKGMEALDYQEMLSYSENFIVALLIVLVVGFEVWLLNRGANYLKRKLNKAKPTGLRIKSVELVSGGKLRLLVLGLINLLLILVILADIYFSLVFVLSLFPGTEQITQSLINFIFVPLQNAFQSFLDYLPNLFSMIITILIFRYLIRFVKTLATELEKGNISLAGFRPYWARTTARIINFILGALMLILVLPYFPGYESLAFKGVAAFLGALVTISGGSVIANYMAGIVIAYMNPCRIGDWIQVDNTTGEVMEISQFAIKVRTTKQVMVSVPNTKILSSHVINYSGEHENHRTLLHTTISIGYDVHWKEVNKLLLAAAKKTKNLDFSVEPFVRQIKLDDFYIVYELNAYSTDVRQMYQTYSDLHRNILDAFNEAEIEILSPHYRAGRDGSTSTIPANQPS